MFSGDRNGELGATGAGVGVCTISGSVGGRLGLAAVRRKRLNKSPYLLFSGCLVSVGVAESVGVSSTVGAGVTTGAGVGAGDSGSTGAGVGVSIASGSAGDGLGLAAGRRKRLKKPPDLGFSVCLGSVGTGSAGWVGETSGVSGSPVGVCSTVGVGVGVGVGAGVGVGVAAGNLTV